MERYWLVVTSITASPLFIFLAYTAVITLVAVGIILIKERFQDNA